MVSKRISLACMLCLCLAQTAQADSDQDSAQAAVAAGEILPLGQILDAVSARVPGIPIEIELEQENGVWIYEFEIRQENGILMEVEIDATTGRFLEIEQEDG
jgi:uncharacterized membrane protein YkoI